MIYVISQRYQEQLFAVNITLTPEGDAHREEVLALLFEYAAPSEGDRPLKPGVSEVDGRWT